ncbi:hypothetical protein CRUP_006808 [Coryphaenoides rupestris]|nr:hypothetical protein CRUP_006808 [Coryphaenoides rupestris]
MEEPSDVYKVHQGGATQHHPPPRSTTPPPRSTTPPPRSTTLLVSFGLSNQMVVTFKEENLMTFKHLFLKGYVSGGMATYALYRQEDVYDHIDYVLQQYGSLHNITVGNHAYDKNGALYTPLSLCQEYYRNGTIYPGNETFEIDAQLDTSCLQVYPMYPLILREALPGFIIPFKRLVSIRIAFVLKAINLETVRHRELPDCYDFNIVILFNNQAHSGRIKVDLDNDVDINECRDWKVTGATPRNTHFPMLFDILIIMTCITSLVLCTRSVLNGIQLQFVLTSYDVCSIFLGLGTMFVWIGVIRYLGYFKKYNASYPPFLDIYMSYFRTLNTASECLFSLINGDDMFPTFKNMQQKSQLVWTFSRVYLYTFVSLFIYMILSLFITLITNTYDTIKQQQNATPTSELQKFMLACEDLPNSGVYRIQEKPNCFLSCCIPR